MADAVSICNRSLLSIGARTTISSLSPSDGSTASDACTILFDPTFSSLGRTAQWGCLRKQATLSLLAAAQGTPENPQGTTFPLPPSPYLYMYALPPDSLAFWYIVPSFPAQITGGPPPTTFSLSSPAYLYGQGTQIPYEIGYSTDANGSPFGMILTNQTQAQGVYAVNQPNPAIWDSQFQAAMVASLGAYLVPALALNFTLMQMCIKTAENIIAMARASDANESVTTQNREADWIVARGGYYEPSFNPGAFGGYSAMCWPAG